MIGNVTGPPVGSRGSAQTQNPAGRKKKNRLDTNRPSHGRTWPQLGSGSALGLWSLQSLNSKGSLSVCKGLVESRFYETVSMVLYTAFDWNCTTGLLRG